MACVSVLCHSKTQKNPPPFGFTPKPSQLALHIKRKVSCKVSNDNNNCVDRRNVLIGLGAGLYGGVASSSAAPIPYPSLDSCSTAIIKDNIPVPYSCCPPKPPNPQEISYYKFPVKSNLRIRPAAHAVDEEYMAKYNLAISKMKELDVTDPDNPHGFKQQANIHCAYCNGAYKVGGKKLQVHFSWLFFPFHRWYLYFYEKILGKLIGDPTFALPYWNWDHPKGMRLPHMFDQPNVYPNLYDPKRNQAHRGETIIDLGHFHEDVKASDLQVMSNNLTLMYRQMVTNSPCAKLFFGKQNDLGVEPSPRQGAIENIPHTPVHIWVGDDREKNGEDMGNFYSAGLDPVFYCHHGNIDRMWTIWKTLGGKRKDIHEQDYLNSEFFFWDENKKPVKVRVRDCLENKKMGYDYQAMPTPWRYFKPLKKSKTKVNPRSVPPATQVFPIAKLDKVISFSITRPISGRTQKEKEEKEEILNLNNITYDDGKHIRFDVFLNVDKTFNWHELDRAEFAGSYTNLPHVHGDDEAHMVTTTFQLAITELLEEIGLEDEDSIVVTLVPKTGGDLVSIQSAEITLDDC